MIGKQMVECISDYYNADLFTVRSITDINKGGRRVQDKYIADGKEVLEKEKEAKLRRETMNMDQIKEITKTIVPDYELNQYTEEDVAWRNVTKQLRSRGSDLAA